MCNKGFAKFFIIFILLISSQPNSLGAISDEHSPINYITNADIYKDYNATHKVKKMESWLAISGGSSGFTVDYPKNNLSYSMYVDSSQDIDLTTQEFDWSVIPSYIEFNNTCNNFDSLVSFLGNDNDDLFGFMAYEDSGYGGRNIYESEFLSSFDLLSDYPIASILVDLRNLILTVTDSTVTNYDYYYEFTYNIYYEIWVFVIDNTAPIVNDILDFNSSVNTYHKLYWDVGDSNPDKYNLTINNILVIKNYQWQNGTVQYNFISQELGKFNLLIFFYDQFGNVASDNITITVQDVNIPEIIGEKEYTFEDGSTSNNVILSIIDDTHTSFNLFVNNVIYLNNTPVVNNLIEVNFDHLTLGLYNISFEIYDIVRNTNNFNVSIQVLDTTSPVINMNDEYIFYTNESTKIDVRILERHPDYYELFMDDVLIETGKIASNNIILDLNVTEIGNYIFTLYIFDTSGNKGSKVINVTIEDLVISTPELSLPINFKLIPQTIIFVSLISKIYLQEKRNKAYFMTKDI